MCCIINHKDNTYNFENAIVMSSSNNNYLNNHSNSLWLNVDPIQQNNRSYHLPFKGMHNDIANKSFL